ncbi:VWA domain-containing protein [Halorubrum aethiopicum]|uniref:VWA domain-containing protein n=1 Tax=Halorubrum aethiopicum TaxID=1758255 RepID=UPI000829734E|nr:VWA domain-containing protein [Halorubrum aethiopicum]
MTDPVAGSDPPPFAEVRDFVREEVVRFVRSLRHAGVAVPANAGVTAARALVEVGFDDETRARAALRACLVADPDDAATFDRQFPEFWRRLTAGLSLSGPAPRDSDGPEGALAPLGADPSAEPPGTTPDDGGDGSADDGSDGAADSRTATERALVGSGLDGDDGEEGGEDDDLAAAWYSPVGQASEVTGIEGGRGGLVGSLEEAFSTLTPALHSLRGRRWRGDGDERADVRRALRASFGTGGTVLSVPRTERRLADVRALWFVDVSRSVLETVDRTLLLATLQYARSAWRDCRIVLFDEDAREVTDAFGEPTPSAALAALERAETEWGGGTRIGGSLASFHRTTPDAVDRRTVVFVVSDGLEMGDVGELEAELAWLSARARGVVWLNPLAAAPAYEPTAAGMASALPFLDGLFAFAAPADLAEVGRQLARNGLGGRIGYEYDPRRDRASA